MTEQQIRERANSIQDSDAKMVVKLMLLQLDEMRATKDSVKALAKQFNAVTAGGSVMLTERAS